MGEAGWKQDPARGDRHRWWDGVAWTDHVAPGPDGAATGTDPLPVGRTEPPRPTPPQPAEPAPAAATTPAAATAAPNGAIGTSTSAAGETWPRSAGTLAEPVWATATPAPSRGGLPIVTLRAVQRILVAVAVVMLAGASIRMITLQSVAGNTVAESFYNAVGWALLGGTLWGVAVFSVRELEAERQRRADVGAG